MDYIINGDIFFEGKALKRDHARLLQKKIEGFLYSLEIPRDEVVGIMLDRTPIMIITIFALLNMGQPFLNIDKKIPAQRVEDMFKIADVHNIIAEHRSDVDKYDLNYISINKCVRSESSVCVNQSLNGDWTDKIAYVLFTSGTTGSPKGVQILHRNLTSFIEAIPKHIPIEARNAIASFSNYSFDIFFLESVLCLILGMDVYLANEQQCLNPRMMKQLLLESDIDVLQITPSRLIMLGVVDPDLSSLEKVRILMVGGEKFPFDLLRKLQKHKGLRIYNMYGPTETTIWSCISELTKKNSVDIGKPILGTRIHIFNEKQNRFIHNTDEVGEICISGAGVGQGYVNDLELTQTYFRKCSQISNKRVYFTGDLGFKTKEGTFVCLGRKDTQVKIAGHRVELEDIDSNIMKHKYIKLAVTCFSEKTQKLITFYTCRKKISNTELYRQLKATLPLYMIPQAIIEVSKIKYTVSGKVDRSQMLYEYENGNLVDEQVRMQDFEEGIILYLLKCIMRYTSYQEVSEDSKIEMLRISSIDYVRLVLELETKYSIEFDDEFLVSERFLLVSDIKEYLIKKIIEKEKRNDN